MIELAQHIEALLLENDCVIVPNFGGFVAHYAPATYVKEENLFLPPTRIIGFNSQLKLNDGVLVQSYMSAHDTSFADATRMVEKEVNAFVEILHEEGKADLENVGEIRYNIYGNYEFTPYDHKITTPSLYGLDSFEMRELSALQRKERILVPASLTKEKKTYEISISRTLLRNAAAMIAVIVMFFAFSTPVENTYVEKNNYAQLLPAELFEQIEKQSVAVTPVSVETKHNQKNATGQTKKVTADKARTSRPIAVKEVKVAKQETTPAAPTATIPTTTAVTTPVAPAVQPQANHPFHIIVAGGIGLKDAEAMAEQLKAKGFAEAKALNSDGKVRVSIRLGKSKVKALRKEENLEEEAEVHKEEFGYITVIENVFGFKQVLPLQEGDNVIGRRCVGTVINTPIESGDMSMDRRHCIINVKRNKQGKLVYTLRDAPSLTGTFLMNEILGDKDRVRMEDGAIVTIGATTFILHTAEAE